MKVLALDPSLSSTGYAILNESKELIDKGKINTSPKYSTDDRILKIITILDEFSGIDVVVLEDGFVGFNAQGSLKLAELRGAIIFFHKYNCKEVIHMQPKEIRKKFGLKGSAKKDEVAERVLEYYPYLESEIGPYSDKANKDKTSDIYDAISIGLSYIINLEE